MALVRTTTTAAIAVTDTIIAVTSASGITAGSILLVDSEFMQVQSSYTAGLLLPVLRGRNGSATLAHALSAGVTAGTSADFADPPAQSAASVNLPANRVREIRSVSANGLIANPKPGTDLFLIIQGAVALTTLTLGNPGKDNDGDMIVICSAAVAAHVITYATGFGGVAANDVVTFAAGQGGFAAIACNEKWIALGGVVPA